MIIDKIILYSVIKNPMILILVQKMHSKHTLYKHTHTYFHRSHHSEQWLTDMRQRVVVDVEVSSWKSVLSGVPQGSVLGPILFLVYINDLEEGVTGKLLKFADDTKLFRKAKAIGDKKKLQDDIDKLVKWSEKWQMLFNFGKCKCLHIGPGNTSMNYEMGGTIYTIILLKSVCMSVFTNCRSQFLLDRLWKCI